MISDYTATLNTYNIAYRLPTSRIFYRSIFIFFPKLIILHFFPFDSNDIISYYYN